MVKVDSVDNRGITQEGKRRSALFEMVKEFFGEDKEIGVNFGRIDIHQIIGNYSDRECLELTSIYPDFDLIVVYNNDFLDKAMEFAKKYEHVTGREVTLRRYCKRS